MDKARLDLAAKWRALMYVPAHVEKFHQKAAQAGADAIIFDLEDAVPAAQKQEARGMLAQAANIVRGSGNDVLVRINREIEWGIADVDAALEAQADAVVVAKVEGPAHLTLLADYLDRHERRFTRARPLYILPLIETLEAFWMMREIAKASERVIGMAMGGEDIAAQIHAASGEDTLAWPRQQMIFAAASAGIAPFGLMGSIADFADPENVLRVARNSRRYGFWGATCSHPKQVGPIKQAFQPTEAEIADARQIVEALEQAAQAGLGAVEVNGRMIDAPVAARARRIVELGQ